MSNKRSKNHHFLPQCIQKNFCHSGRSIWYSKKLADGAFSVVEERNIARVFKERNHYTVLDEENNPTDFLEREVWKNLDDFWDEFISEIVRIFASGRVPRIPDPIKLNLIHAIALTYRRSPDTYSNVASDFEIGVRFFNDVISSKDFLSLEEPEQEELVRRSNDEKHVLEIGRSIRAQAQVTPIDQRIIDALGCKEIRWVEAQGAAEFILCQRMIYRIGNGASNGLDNPSSEWWMPLTPKIALVLVEDKSSRIPRVVKLDWDDLFDLNEHALEISSMVAAHSKEVLDLHVQRFNSSQQ